MGKSKKAKNKGQIDDFNNEDADDLDILDSKQKEKNINSDNDELDDDIKINQSQVPVKKANKKSKKKKKIESDDDDSDIDILKQTTERLALDDDDDDEPEIKPKKKSQSFPKKSAFALLNIDDGDMDIDNDSGCSDEEAEEESEKIPEKVVVEVPVVNEKPNKKSKKKNRKKNVDEEEDIDKIMAELELEYNGGKKEEPISNNATVISEKIPESSAAEETNVEESKPKTDETSEKVTEAKANSEEKSEEGNDPETGSTVKTAAQKKKEKKERERQKKLQQKAQEKKKTKSQPQQVEEPAKEEKPAEEEADKEEEEEEDGKKKKKKKKGEVEEKKKKPGKKQLLAMQEALKEIERAKEKAKLDEEARIKAAEEAEKLKEEKLKIELEKKERKKQKEKEKKERLKAEGKLLTKAQRQAKARAEASLQALREQGFDIPAAGEKKARPKYTTKKKSNKKTEDAVAQTETSNSDSKKNETALEAEKEEIKDAWDVSDEEEEKTDKSDDKESTPDKTENADLSAEESTDESDDNEEENGSVEEDKNHQEAEVEATNEKVVEKIKETPYDRIQRKREEAAKNQDFTKLRSPIVCVLGHVDTGKTKILDKIRRTNVQDGEAGGITQQIGATMIPADALKEQCKMVKGFPDLELKVPGLLVIDTPGHESFSNLRSRGSSLCDIAILVVDIMHGLEPQTIESINLLKQRKTPFVIALNKVDRLYDWRQAKSRDVRDTIKNQARNTMLEFQERCKEVILQFAEQSLNAKLFYENDDPRKYLSLVPTSALSGDGMGNLLGLVVELTQSMLSRQLAFSKNLQATVLEVKAIPGLGTTIDVILVNGTLKEGDTIILAGVEGPVVTQIRSLLMPQPMRELRVKNPYREFKSIEAAQGIKIAGKELDKAIAGLNMLVASQPDEIEILKEEVSEALSEVMQSIKLADRGVYVQASTLGSLEALLEFLKTSSIPYCGIRIGPVVKKDVMKASIMLEHDKQYAVILAFDVKIERDAQEMADSIGVKIFSADIIYHLFDSFMKYREDLKKKKREEFKHIAVFPCKLRVLPQCIFNARDPIVVGISVEAGVVREGTPICVPSQNFVQLGIVTTLEINHKTIESARKGQEVCVKIEPIPGEAPKLYGRHFDHKDMLVSKISRDSIDACKNYFRDDLIKSDWQLMVELKKLFEIL